VTAEQAAQLFHETYERLAPAFGYETRRESAVAWEQVPDANRRLMVAVAAVVLDEAAKEDRHTIKQLERQLADARGETATADPLAPKIHEIAAYWRDKCNHPKAKLDPKRYRAVRARLICRDQDETVDDRVAYIKQAIDGAAHAALVNERTGEPYNDLELICRNEVKLDSFARRAPAGDDGDLERKLIGA
jgi:hypothetical protein